MKKIYLLLSILMVTGSLMAQVKVTYMVDIRKYLAAGTPLGANGIRIGGDFVATNAKNGTTAMPAWSPSDAACAMIDYGDSLWTITVTYPAASIGMTQAYKFVNNNWGTNEGTAATSTIATDGCGTDDGGGNINRSLVIPDFDITLQYCWDACNRCNGANSDITSVRDIKTFSASVFPNPVNSGTRISLNLQKASDVTISIVNLTGREVLKTNYNRESAGNHIYNIDLTAIPAGIYLYRVVSGGSVASGNIVKL